MCAGPADYQRDPGVGQGRPPGPGLCDGLRQHPDVHLQHWTEIQVDDTRPGSSSFCYCQNAVTRILLYSFKKMFFHYIQIYLINRLDPDPELLLGSGTRKIQS